VQQSNKICFVQIYLFLWLVVIENCGKKIVHAAGASWLPVRHGPRHPMVAERRNDCVSSEATIAFHVPHGEREQKKTNCRRFLGCRDGTALKEEVSLLLLLPWHFTFSLPQSRTADMVILILRLQ
jgi:hypothetical protein